MSPISRPRTPRRRLVLGLAAALSLSACTVGPDYVRPDVVTPASYKEDRDWKLAQPADDLRREHWWSIYRDPTLDALEAQVGANQNIAQAEAQYRQSLALVDSARAGYYPSVGVNGDASKQGSGPGRNGGASSRTVVRTVTASVSWEIDLWGRVRRLVEAEGASAQASAADLANIVLSTQASVASAYFQLRQVDATRALLDDTIAAYRRTLEVTRNRYAGGVSARVDVAQAETQLKNAQVDAIQLGVSRAQLEHAIALLLGRPASAFSIAVEPWQALIERRPAPVPVADVPSALLERRPDIAAAERRMAAANAEIGYTKAAYYPTISLSGQGSFTTPAGVGLFASPYRFWSIGPAIAETIFDGGLRRAQTAQAVAAYDASIGAYRQTVLAAFAEVEDQLAALRIYEQQADAQQDALASARESLALTINQYKAGTVSYLDVVTTQTVALASERNAVAIFGDRMVASVTLVRALGGGWSTSDAPATP